MWEPPQPSRIVTAAELADMLDVLPQNARDLVRAGIVGDPYALDDAGKRLAVDFDVARHLSQRRWVDEHQVESAIVVKTGPAVAEVGSDRAWRGWHEKMPEHEKESATNRWWPIPRDVDPVGKLLVVVVSTFVVRVRRIEGGDRDPADGLWKLTTSPEQETGYRDTRIRARRGPLVDLFGL